MDQGIQKGNVSMRGIATARLGRLKRGRGGSEDGDDKERFRGQPPVGSRSVKKECVSFQTVQEVMAWCRAAPAGTQVDAAAIAELLRFVLEKEPIDDGGHTEALSDARTGWTWRERIWVVPAETRLGVAELAEALGRPKSWVYARTHRYQGKGTARKERRREELIPHRKMGGALAFTAGEIRTWIRLREEEVSGVPMDFVGEGGRA